MRFTIETSALMSALKLLGKVINKKSPLPILGCLLFQATREGALVLTATDLETSLQTSIPCHVDLPGEVAIPLGAVKNAMRSLKVNPEVHIATHEEVGVCFSFTLVVCMRAVWGVA